MSSERTQTADRQETSTGRAGEGEVTDHASRVPSPVVDRTRDGSLPLVAGVVALLAAARSALAGRRRAGVLALAGLGLTWFGVRRRSDAGSTGGDAAPGSDESGRPGTPEDQGRLSETRPSGEVAGERRIDGDDRSEGDDVTYTDEPDGVAQKPELDDPADPRLESEGEDVEVDVSEPALADEPAEATGPEAEQAQPARTEETEPESSPAADASHVEADVPNGERHADRDEPDELDRDDDAGDVAEPTQLDPDASESGELRGDPDALQDEPGENRPESADEVAASDAEDESAEGVSDASSAEGIEDVDAAVGVESADEAEGMTDADSATGVEDAGTPPDEEGADDAADDADADDAADDADASDADESGS